MLRTTLARRNLTYVGTFDGIELQAICYEPAASCTYSNVVVINSGAGTPKELYEAFANWAADHGIVAITYDYRGVGGSRGRSIRKLSATIGDWGSKDCAAILRFVAQHYPQARIHLVGHSIGTMVPGYVTGAPKPDTLILISPHTGYAGEYAKHHRTRLFLLWHVISPTLTRVVGFFPGRFFGLPEDLPGGIALGWSRRRNKNSVGDDRMRPSLCQGVPALVIRPSDDPFATKAAKDRVIKNLECHEVGEVMMARGGRRRIGHFGFFSRGQLALWSVSLRFWGGARLDAF